MIVLRSGGVDVDVNDNCYYRYSYKPHDTYPLDRGGIVTRYGFIISKEKVTRPRPDVYWESETQYACVFIYEDEVDEMYADIEAFWKKYIEGTNTIHVDGGV